jgi:hypothetical protein
MEDKTIDYIGADELVFNMDKGAGIYSGGFNVNSIMMKAGMSPIMTVNSGQLGGGSSNVSDLFKDLVVPSWSLSYHNKMTGGEYKDDSDSDSNSDSDSDSDIDDDLHDRLVNLARDNEAKLQKKNKKKTTRRQKAGAKTKTKRKN